MHSYSSRRRLLAGAALLALAAGPAFADPAPSSGPSNDTVSEVVVTAQRLDAARDTIQPQLGASTYAMSAKVIQSLPGGDNTQLNQVILQAPGVAQDSYGQLHVRGEHNGLQFRLNGVILPEGLSVFSQALNPRLAQNVELITGALPAQYGLRTAGIVDITTKSGAYANGGEVSVYGGSHNEFEPSAELHGSSGSFNYFASLNYLQNDLGIESPDGRANPLHDKTQQLEGFAYLEDIINPDTRASLILGTSNQRFQIPNVAGKSNGGLVYAGQPLSVEGQTSYPSEALNEQQRENTQYAVLSLLHTTDKLTTQISVFGRYSTLTYTPDVLGDLLYNGIAQYARKTDTAGGLQAEGVYKLNDAHTLRGGVIVEVDRTTSATTSYVMLLDAATGAQLGQSPYAIADNGAQTAETYSAYLQDEWKLTSDLTLNYGLRFDQFDGFRDENQLSPRVNLVWQPAGTGTTVHVGYSRYFSPPPFELIASESVGRFVAPTGNPAVTSTAAPPNTKDTTPYSERAHYFDVGVSQKVSPELTVGLDTYYKISRNLIDEGQFGAPIILTPFNYAKGRQYGVELTASYDRGPFSAYANFAYEKAQGEDIVSSQFNFDPADLAYIKTHYIYLDHDQTYSASLGASYLWLGTRLSADLIYGSGLRADGAVPNGRELAPYTQVNLGVSHRFEHVPTGPVEVRFDLINAFDKVYEIRDGTGVGVGAPQFGPRRGFFGGITKEF
ncbi:MAG: TonB-dependent receptor [Caulobacteraceae bacterium]|nr:TonB-dependent receptor [Caulobacteraceae bacterium]